MSLIKAENFISGINESDNEEDLRYLDSKKILGKVFFSKWGKKYEYYFSLDVKAGKLLCYKEISSKKRNTWISLLRAKMSVKDKEQVINIRTRKGKNILMIPLQGNNFPSLKQYLETCFRVQSKSKTKSLLAYLGKGAFKVLKLPFRMTSGLIFSLEKLGDTARKPLKDKNKKNKTKKMISNPATGLLVGTSSMVNEIVTAISGLVVEPMKGMKKGGIKGGALGVGKGIYGLIVKPVAGTIDLVTMTARGVGNMPGTIYRNLFKLKRKKKNKKATTKSQSNQEEEKQDDNMEKLAENDDEILYVNKNNPFGVEKIKELTRKVKEQLEVDEDRFNSPPKDHPDKDEDEEEDSLEVEKIIKFYKTQNSKEGSCMDFKEDMCEFIIISPDLDHEGAPDTEVECERLRALEKRADSPKKHLSINSPSKTESLTMCLPKEFVVSSNPFLKSTQNASSSISPQKSPKAAEDKFRCVSEEEVKNDSSESSGESESDEDFIDLTKKPSWRLKEDDVIKEEEEEESESDESSENEEILIKYKVKFPSCKAKNQEIWNNVKSFAVVSNKDDVRCENSYKSGGQVCPDPDTVKNIRSVGKELIKEIGRKIISGSFNLTTISFPIKSMIPKSALENIFQGVCFFPLYVNRATTTKDPLERLRLVITASISSFYMTNSFGKPLNPYLGETFQGNFNDGTKMYSEQISHHPPISYFLVYGPQKNYRFYGHYLYEAKAGLNTLTFYNRGRRKIRFLDGQEIQFTFAEEYYSGNFMGTMKHETLGQIDYFDKANNLSCSLKFGSAKKRPTDYFETEILRGNQPVCKVFGTYRGYIEFDGKRYWDYRYFTPIKFNIEESVLGSDHRRRADLQHLKKGQLKLAQEKKESLEDMQRRDAKLRKEYGKKQRR